MKSIIVILFLAVTSFSHRAVQEENSSDAGGRLVDDDIDRLDIRVSRSPPPPHPGEIGSELNPSHVKLMRAIPATAVIFAFFLSLAAIQWKLHKAAQKRTEHDILPFGNDKLSSKWLKTLKNAQQPRPSIANIVARRGSSIGSSLGFNVKRERLKKYALYDEMLEKYKRSVRIQRQHTLRKQARSLGTASPSQAMTSDISEKANESPSPCRTRVKDMALRHRALTQESSEDEYGKTNLLHWDTQQTSSFDANTEQQVKERLVSIESDEVFEDKSLVTKASAAVSSNHATAGMKSVAFADRKLDGSATSKASVTVKPRSDGAVFKPIIYSETEDEEADVFAGHARSQLVDDESDTCRTLSAGSDAVESHEPDIKQALERLSESDPLPSVMFARPLSMFVVGMDTSKTQTHPRPQSVIALEREKDEKKKRTWYQGIFGNAGTKPKEPSKSVDDLIKEEMLKAVRSRIPTRSPDTIYQKEDVDEPRTEGDSYIDMVSQTNETSASSCMNESKMNSLKNSDRTTQETRPVSWFGVPRNQRLNTPPFSNSSEHIDAKKLKRAAKARPKSIAQFYKLQSGHFGKSFEEDEDPVTGLFATLMNLPPKAPSRGTSRQSSLGDVLQGASGSRAVIPETKKEKRQSLKRSEKDMERMLREVERRMIQRINNQTTLQDTEVTALENLLDEVSGYCTDFCEDWRDTKDRRQMSFSEVNDELQLSLAENSSGEAERVARADKTLSIYDTDLLDPNTVKLLGRSEKKP